MSSARMLMAISAGVTRQSRALPGVHPLEAFGRIPSARDADQIRATLARPADQAEVFRSRAASARIASRSCVWPRVTTTT